MRSRFIEGNIGTYHGPVVNSGTTRKGSGRQAAQRTHNLKSRTEITCDLAEVFEQFLEARQRFSDPKPLRPKTVRSYRQALGEFRTALLSAKHEEDLGEAVRAIIDERIESRKISEAGMNVYIRGVNSFFSWCFEIGFLHGNVKIKLLHVERRRRPQTLGSKDIENWQQFKCSTFSQLRVKHIGLLVLDSGVRVEECLSLRESDIDWKGSRLWIRRGKGGANREVPLSSDGMVALRRYLALTSLHRPKDGRNPALIFATAKSRPFQYRNALRDLKKVADRLGMRWVGWHSFRRTFATQYIQNRGLITNLQQILGHADLRTTILYLGNEIEEIVALHDQHSPISSTRRASRRSGTDLRSTSH
jgi:integrase/recombinase XerD